MAPLTQPQKELVHATEPIPLEQGVAITSRMYETMLAAHPELKNIFSTSGQASGEQQKALAGSLIAYSTHIEDLAPLIGVVQRIAAKHAALGVKPQHYPMVGEHLIGAIVHVLGEAFTPELQDAWYHAALTAHANWNLARLFIELESDIRAAAPWPGFATFKIAKKVEESPSITSFYLEPTDRTLLPLRPYLAGQYLTVRVWVEALQHFQASFPSGTFTIPDPLPKHVIFLSAGVGITPNLAMLNSLVDLSKTPTISWIQGAQNRVEHVFSRHVREIGEKRGDKFREVVFYSRPGPET